MAIPRTTLVTCSVYADLTKLWYYWASASTDQQTVGILILDCGAQLLPAEFPRANIKEHPNEEHGRKLDYAARLAESELLFFLDDDAFLLSREVEPWAAAQFASDAELFACTFLPSATWVMMVNGTPFKSMGSYGVMVRRRTLVDSGLSLASKRTADAAVNNGAGYWDTMEWFQYHVLARGGHLLYAPERLRMELPTFFAASTAYVSLVVRKRLLHRVAPALFRRLALARACRDRETLHRTITLGAVIEAYRALFKEEPRFHAWPALSEIEGRVILCRSPELREFGQFWISRARGIGDRLAT